VTEPGAPQGAMYESVPGPLSCTALRNDGGSIVELKDGRLLIAYSEYYGPPYRWDLDDDFWAARIVGRFSDDLGRTWGERFVIQENDAEINILAPSLLRLQTGELAIFYRKTESLSVPVLVGYMKKSHDEGRTWGEEICIAERMPGGREAYLSERMYAPGPCDCAVQLSSGRILIPAARMVRTAPADDSGVAWSSKVHSFCVISDDNGETWKRGEGETTAPRRGAMEPHVAELKDGRLIMVLRTQMGHVYRSWSEDGGEHWTESEPIPEIIAPESCPQLGAIPGTGDLLLVHNRDYQPGADHSGRRNPLSTAISTDGGRTWGHFRDLVIRDYGTWQDQKGNTHSWSWVLSNPGLTFVKDKAVISFCEGCPRHYGGIAPCSQKAVVVDLDWLYA